MDLLGLEKYCELTSIDYNVVFAIRDIENIVNGFYNNSKLGLKYEMVLWILESMLEGTYDLVEVVLPLQGCALLKMCFNTYLLGLLVMKVLFMIKTIIIELIIVNQGRENDVFI